MITIYKEVFKRGLVCKEEIKLTGKWKIVVNKTNNTTMLYLEAKTILWFTEWIGEKRVSYEEIFINECKK